MPDLSKLIRKRISQFVLVCILHLFFFLSAVDAGQDHFVRVHILTAHDLSQKGVELSSHDHLALLDGKTVSLDSHVFLAFKNKISLRVGKVVLYGSTLELVPNKADSLLSISRMSMLFGRYPGKIIFKKEGDRWVVINRVPFESYVAGVVGAESFTRNQEFLKALSVVVRTRAASGGPHNGRMFCDRTCCMIYRGIPRKEALAATFSTKGEVISYDGKLCPVYFHSCCGGKTVAVEKGIVSHAPHRALVGVSDRDKAGRSWCRKGRNFRWKRKIDDKNFNDVIIDYLKIRNLGEPEYPLSIERESFDLPLIVYGRREPIKIDPVDFRLFLGRKLGWNILLSDRFKVKLEGSDYHFTGQGFGHRVGLCQAGALARIEKGEPYPDVLRAYFPGTKIISFDLISGVTRNF